MAHAVTPARLVNTPLACDGEIAIALAVLGDGVGATAHCHPTPPLIFNVFRLALDSPFPHPEEKGPPGE